MNDTILFPEKNKWFLGFPKRSESYWFGTLKEALSFVGIDYYPEKPGIHVAPSEKITIKNNVID